MMLKSLGKKNKKQVLQELSYSTYIFILGLLYTLYLENKTGYFNYFVFNSMSLIASIGLFKIGYIFYKNKQNK